MSCRSRRRTDSAIHADSVWNHRVIRREHAADRQAVAHVRIWHERARHRNRQRTCIRHLLDRVGLESFTSLTPRHELRARRERWTIDRASQRRPQFVGEERRWVGQELSEGEAGVVVDGDMEILLAPSGAPLRAGLCTGFLAPLESQPTPRT